MLVSLLSQFADVCSVKGFFGIPPWYAYLVKNGRMAADTTTGVCTFVQGFQWWAVNTPGKSGGGDLVLVALGIVDILLRVSALVAVGFVTWGGIQYVTSDGEPDKTKAAQQTIINALAGLGIAIVATAVVSFIGNRIG